MAMEMPGYNVLMGFYVAPNVTSDTAALILYTIKFLILTLTLNCFSASISLVTEHYRADANCFHVTGIYVIYSPF